jgi:hypothetical protein
LILSCGNNNSKKNSIVNLDNYFSLDYKSFDINGETINVVTSKIVERSDSIGAIINKRQKRIRYLLTNRINWDTLNKLLPDSSSIKKLYHIELNNPDFKSNIEKVLFPNKFEKHTFTIDEMMLIASKFFLVEKRGNRGLGIRVCSGINGQIENQKVDYTLLETIVFDAINDRMLNKQMPNAIFLDSVNVYLTNSINKNHEVESLDSLESIARKSVFFSMEKDEDLKKTILEYYKINKENIPIIITER